MLTTPYNTSIIVIVSLGQVKFLIGGDSPRA